jgi:hypothetical protein
LILVQALYYVYKDANKEEVVKILKDYGATIEGEGNYYRMLHIVLAQGRRIKIAMVVVCRRFRRLEGIIRMDEEPLCLDTCSKHDSFALESSLQGLCGSLSNAER